MAVRTARKGGFAIGPILFDSESFRNERNGTRFHSSIEPRGANAIGRAGWPGLRVWERRRWEQRADSVLIRQ